MEGKLTEYEDATEIAADVRGLLEGVEHWAETAGELRRELAVHREPAAEDELVDAVKYLKWAANGIRAALTKIDEESLLDEDAALSASGVRALPETRVEVEGGWPGDGAA